VAYEKGDWATFSKLAAELNLDESRVPEIYTESLKWATEAFALS
jgi:hypothetical protein